MQNISNALDIESDRLYTISTMFNVKPLNEKEIDFINISKSLIPYVGNVVSVVGCTKTLDSVLSESLDNLKLFKDPNLPIKTLSILRKLPFYQYPNIQGYATHISYEYNPDTKTFSNKGNVEHITTPTIFGEEAPISITHEFIHMLKDTNINEYVLMFRYSEIIPLLYELISMNESKNREQLLKNRLILLKYEVENINFVIEQIKLNPILRNQYLCVLSQSGKYILDLYYALQLYELYLIEPHTILEQIRLVLNHTITTQEMLIKLDLYDKLDYNTYKESFKEHVTKTI